MLYEIDSSDYLKRARERLDEGTPEALFYAAFELRAGIENRLRQYQEALARASRKAQKDYRIERLSKRLERAFKTGEKVVKVSVYTEDDGKLISTLYYTPVRRSLRKRAEKLGEYLHGMQKHRPENDLWWKSTREFLEGTYAELLEANRGKLIGPPMVNLERRTANMQVEIVDTENPFGEEMKTLVGRRIVVQLDYIDKHPDLDLPTSN
ncbi:MAG: hypothetical protein HY676_02045 [Chloroflexi bacterium]|nr:hypothetical protein [Chloroflexota bacterium]